MAQKQKSTSSDCGIKDFACQASQPLQLLIGLTGTTFQVSQAQVDLETPLGINFAKQVEFSKAVTEGRRSWNECLGTV